MNAVATLGWLEWRQFVNRLRVSIRQPARLIVFAVGIAYLAFLLWVRTLPGSIGTGRPNAFHFGVPEPFASLICFAVILFVAFTFQATAAGYIRGFESAADARFFIGSALPERLVVLWVELRTCASTVFRAVWAILVYTLLFHRAGSSLGIVLTSVGLFVLLAALPIPMLKIDRATHLRVTQALAVVFWCLGGIPFALLAAAWFLPSFSWAGSEITHLGGGNFVNGLILGSAAALAPLYGMIIVFFGLCYALGNDIYPELYAGSTRVIRLRERQQRGAFARTMERERHVVTEFRAPRFLNAFRGAWTLIWRDVTTFGRSSGLRQMFWVSLLAAILVGAGIGVFARRSHDVAAVSIAMSSSLINVYVILVALGSTIVLGDDLRKPLFWLCADPLRARLYAWTVSSSWRPAIAFSIGILTWAFTARVYTVAWLGIPIALTLVLLLRAVGLATYALVPGKADQRGPLAMFRMLLTYALIVPPIVTGVMLVVLTHQAFSALSSAVLVAIVETLLLIEFAAWRIDGRGAAVAHDENV
ncbi:MAG: hypothetical protein JO165_09030 [Candidatus Eremiobacteraeota bacterium]|nr:hypothetical protein [Candidatus Eremiobacteraeota bacterium]